MKIDNKAKFYRLPAEIQKTFAELWVDPEKDEITKVDSEWFKDKFFEITLLSEDTINGNRSFAIRCKKSLWDAIWDIINKNHSQTKVKISETFAEMTHDDIKELVIKYQFLFAKYDKYKNNNKIKFWTTGKWEKQIIKIAEILPEDSVSRTIYWKKAFMMDIKSDWTIHDYMI